MDEWLGGTWDVLFLNVLCALVVKHPELRQMEINSRIYIMVCQMYKLKTEIDISKEEIFIEHQVKLNSNQLNIIKILTYTLSYT